jgi:hypothetical protein
MKFINGAENKLTSHHSNKLQECCLWGIVIENKEHNVMENHVIMS